MGNGVLVVDDSSLARDSVAKMLRPHVGPVHLACDAEEGMRLVASESPAVVISDYRMPGKNGIEFLSEVAKKAPSAVRILLTAAAELEVAIQAINVGHVYKFFTKSIPRDELQESLLQICRYCDVIANTPARDKTVLVADPSTMIGSMIEQVLWSTYRIMTVTDGLGALRRIDEQQVDLLVTASQLRYLGGLELVTLLKQTRKVEFPVILFTSEDRPSLAGAAQPDLIVKKSEDWSNLFDAINGFLQT